MCPTWTVGGPTPRARMMTMKAALQCEPGPASPACTATMTCKFRAHIHYFIIHSRTQSIVKDVSASFCFTDWRSGRPLQPARPAPWSTSVFRSSCGCWRRERRRRKRSSSTPTARTRTASSPVSPRAFLWTRTNLLLSCSKITNSSQCLGTSIKKQDKTKNPSAIKLNWHHRLWLCTSRVFITSYSQVETIPSSQNDRTWKVSIDTHTHIHKRSGEEVAVAASSSCATWHSKPHTAL